MMKSRSNIDTHRSNRGSILVYALLIMSVMLAIGLSLSAILISKLQQASILRNSTVAIYASDSAGERCLYEARSRIQDPNPLVFDDSGILVVVKNAITDVDVSDASGGCSEIGSQSFDFYATGTYRGASRTLEISQ